MRSALQNYWRLIPMMTSSIRFACIAVLGLGWLALGCTYGIAEEPSDAPMTQIEKTVQALKQKLQNQKTVRILVRLKESPRSLQDTEGSPSPQQQKEQLFSRQKQYVDEIKGEGVLSGKPIKGSSFILMVVNEQGLNRLLATQMVKAIQEDQPGKLSR